MSRGKMIALLASAVAGLAVEAEAAAQAAWKPVVLKVNDPDPRDTARVRNGRLRKTDEEFTNEQGVVRFFAGDRRALYVEMRTGALADGQRPVHRMQAACTPIELGQAPDGSVTLSKLPGERFVTDNDGNEYRNANKPELMPINGGRNMLLMFNYQPANTSDTRRYAKVLDQDCREVPVSNREGEPRKQVLIMAKNNDDCDMHQSGEGPCDVATDAGGLTHLTCWAGCNGNGRDDGWLNDLTVSCTSGADGAATACQIRKNFDVSLARREERSRGRCSFADDDPNTAICTWTEGNTQPQRDGTWIAAVDVTPGGEEGADVQSRLLWKEQLDGRKRADGRTTYSVRAMHTRLLTPRPEGGFERSSQIFFRSGDLRGRNLDDQKGGTYRGMQIGVLKATRSGMEWVLPLTESSDLLLGLDGTHLSMCGAIFGSPTSPIPGFGFLQGSHNGGGASEAVFRPVGFDPASRKLLDFGMQRTGAHYDRHLYSNYLGNNPGNQGRNFAGCTLLKNPFAGQNGNTQEYFVALALTGKSPETADRPELKPTSFVSLLPVATTVGTRPLALEASEDEASGCSSTGAAGPGGHAALLVLLILAAHRRRARAA